MFTNLPRIIVYEFTNLRIYEFTENYCRRDLCIQGDDDNLSLDDTSKKLAWKQHYERLLNIEFPWSHVDPVVSPAQFITPKTLKEWESGWTPGVVADMLKVAPYIYCNIIADLRNAIILEGKVPADWSDNIIVSLFRGKRDALNQNNYRGRKLTDHVLKVSEGLVENIIRETVNIDKM